MSVLQWDLTGERKYETGVKKPVLYKKDKSGAFPQGVAWNGVTGVDENPSGAEATPLYANDSKYLNLMSKEEYAATITAYTYPDEFAECDGSAEVAKGVRFRQQPRKEFGFSYVTTIGNDTEGTNYGYIIHLVYNCLASPSARNHATMNDNPEAVEMSWDVSTTPIAVEGYEPTAVVEIDSTTVDTEKLAALEAILYGSESEEARLPLPSEIAELFADAA